MAYSKAQLKSNGDKAFPCFLLKGNTSDKCLPIGQCYRFHSDTFILVNVSDIIILYLTLQHKSQYLCCFQQWNNFQSLWGAVFKNLSVSLSHINTQTQVHTHAQTSQWVVKQTRTQCAASCCRLSSEYQLIFFNKYVLLVTKIKQKTLQH